MAGANTTTQPATEATQSPVTAPQTAQTVENTSATKRTPGAAKIREKRAFTATVVTFALTALLCFMASFLLITGTEDKYGVIPSAVTVTVGAINFYFGTKNGGTNV
jgi:hypothetical protein